MEFNDHRIINPEDVVRVANNNDLQHIEFSWMLSGNLFLSDDLIKDICDLKKYDMRSVYIHLENR